MGCTYTHVQRPDGRWAHHCQVHPGTRRYNVSPTIAGDCQLPGRAPAVEIDFEKAAERLGIGNWPITGRLAKLVAAWQAAGYPERTPEEAQQLALLPCEKRRPSGLCEQAGCGKTPDVTVYCHWIARLATARCPRQLW